jgi:Uma2 family endonuclease
MSTAVHLLTLEEFLARPERDDWQREELIEGELILSPGPKVLHAFVVEQLRERLRPLKDQGFVVASDFACVLPNASVPTPDLAAVRRERWEEAACKDEWPIESPELAVEVFSPGNRRLHRKAALYLEHGAEQVWIVYPKRRTVSVFTPEGTSEARMGEALEFHGVKVLVDEIFPV